MTEEAQHAPSPESEPEDQAGGAPRDEQPADLRRELEEAKARADEHFRSWQRSAADFANFKRRVDEEKRFAERWIIQDLLPILDDFDRAWTALPGELRNLTWIQGLLQVHSKLFAVLERHGVSPIESLDKSFSPVEHEAVLHEGEVDLSEQTAIVAELQRGYRLHDRVLRPALVKVGKPRNEESGSSPSPG
jgi:molecular chaperone GrpE